MYSVVEIELSPHPLQHLFLELKTKLYVEGCYFFSKTSSSCGIFNK